VRFSSKKDSDVCQLAASWKKEAEQAQKDLQDFKLQIECSSVEMYQRMKSQVCLILAVSFACLSLSLYKTSTLSLHA